MKILVLDNYDSFTYNLVHLIRDLGYEMDIYRNDKILLEEVNRYDKILLSPGPGIPSEAGIMNDLIKQYASAKSILGVCLGYQGIAEVYGARLINLEKVLHGVTTKARVSNKNEILFKEVPAEFNVGHYHSWVVDPGSIPDILEVTAVDEKKHIMAISHKKYNVKGLQFHPESILTEHGSKIIQNWLDN